MFLKKSCEKVWSEMRKVVILQAELNNINYMDESANKNNTLDSSSSLPSEPKQEGKGEGMSCGRGEKERTVYERFNKERDVCISYASTQYNQLYEYEIDEQYNIQINYYRDLKDNSFANENIVSEIESNLKAFGINLITDKDLTEKDISVCKDNVCVGDNITAFEEKIIGEAKNVIVILSDKYFTSPHCMYEWKVIHENAEKKNIIYLRNDAERIKRVSKVEESFLSDGFKGFDLTKIEYKHSLYDRWCAYMMACVKHYNKPSNQYPKIAKCAFENFFYMDMLDTMESKIRDVKTKKVTDENAITEVCKSMYKCIDGDQNIDYIYCEEEIKDLLCKKTLLVVGDNILKVIDNGTEKRLGDYFNEILLDKAKNIKDGNENNISEWYYNNYIDRNTINQLVDEGALFLRQKANSLQKNWTDLENLLICSSCYKIVSFGYSETIYNVVKHVYGDDNVNLFQLRVQSEDFNKPENLRDYSFYELIHRENDNLILSDITVIDFVNACLIALNGRLKDYDNVMILGTVFPNWVLKFIWERLTNIKQAGGKDRKKSLVNNLIVIDEKNIRLIKNNNGIIEYRQSSYQFFEIIGNIKKEFERDLESKRGHYNVFVSYVPGDDVNFRTFVFKHLLNIERISAEKNQKKLIHFIWKKINDDDNWISERLSKCCLMIFYHSKDTDEILVNTKTLEHFPVDYRSEKRLKYVMIQEKKSDDTSWCLAYKSLYGNAIKKIQLNNLINGDYELYDDIFNILNSKKNGKQ